MGKKHSGATSARKLFIKRTGPLVMYWQQREEGEPPGLPPHLQHLLAFSADKIAPQRERVSELYLRMQSDARMQVAWEALAELSDDDFEMLLDNLQVSRRAAKMFQFRRWCYEAILEEFREVAQAARTLQEFCDRRMCGDWDEEVAALSPPQYLFLPEAKEISLAAAVPGLPDQLRAAQAFLTELQRFVADALAQQVRSRKSLGGRVEFIREVAKFAKNAWGKPRYEVVAALTNVGFNTGDEDSVSAEAIRKIIKRKPDDSTG